MATPTPVNFYFDCGCPFAWITSRWITEVEKYRDIDVNWIPMSLAVLNDGRDLPEEYAAHMVPLWTSGRVFAFVKTNHPDKIADLYTAVGTRLHNDNRREGYSVAAMKEVLRESLLEVGIDESVLEAANSTDIDDDMRRYHQQAMDSVGNDVGTPVIQIDGKAGFFGPVLTRIPRGEEAAQLFDAAVVLGSYPHFFELKRSRTESPSFD